MKKVIILLLASLMIGCTTVKYVEVPKIHRDTIIHNNTLVERDTVYQSEKIVTINDTVYVDRFKFKERTVYRWKTDSVLKVDSIPYPVPTPVPVEVVKYRTSGWGVLGWVLLALAVGAYLYSKFKNVKDLMR